jgi:hypothetical protein
MAMTPALVRPISLLPMKNTALYWRVGGLVKWFDGLAAFFRRLAEGRYRAAVCRARAGERVRREDEWLPCDCAVARIIP